TRCRDIRESQQKTRWRTEVACGLGDYRGRTGIPAGLLIAIQQAEVQALSPVVGGAVEDGGEARADAAARAGGGGLEVRIDAQVDLFAGADDVAEIENVVADEDAQMAGDVQANL